MAKQTGRDTSGHVVAVMDFRNWRVLVWGRGGTTVRAQKIRGTAKRAGGADPLVQPVRFATGLAGYHAASGGRGFRLLPALLHGVATRGRFAQAGTARFCEFHPGSRHL